MSVVENPNYIVVTPMKNEEAFVADLIAAMKNQSVRPILWVIVDDGSTDRSREIIAAETNEDDWVKVIQLPPGKRMRGQHYAYVCKQGFDYAINRVTSWDFIGLVDADMVLEEKYFEKLMQQFNEMENLGIASGAVYVGGKPEKRNLDHPAGCCRLFRRGCFLDIGGYQVYPSDRAAPDRIAKARATMRGWRVRLFPDIMATGQRPTAAERSPWKKGSRMADIMYYFGYHPLLVIGAFLSLLTKRPHYHALSFLFGYGKNLILRQERIPDEEVRTFFRREKWREIMQHFWIYWGG